MKDEDAETLARQILEDLRGSAYYADPQILAGVLAPHLHDFSGAYGVAVDVLRCMLTQYVRTVSSDNLTANVIAALKSV